MADIIKPFKFGCCANPYPTAYDETLSYYEEICKIAYKLNEIINAQNNLQTSFEQVQEWVNTQLKTYSMQQLQEWLNDGTLETLINQTLFNSKISYYDTLQTLKVTPDLVNNQLVKTLGYNAVNDLGECLYLISDTEPESGLYEFLTTSNKYAKLIIGKRINVRQWGITGVSTTDVTTKFIQLCSNFNYIECVENDTYLINNLQISNNVEINCNNSTFTKNTTDVIFNVSSEYFNIHDGIVDGAFFTDGYSHLLTLNNANANVYIQNMTFKNNIKMNGDIVVQNVNADAINIENCNYLLIKNNSISNISRNGISITGAIKDINILSNTINDCYLCGIDIEPNNPLQNMYPLITIENNTINDCGRHDTGYVFNSGGAVFIQAPSQQTLQIIEKLYFNSNRITNNIYYTYVSGQVAPYMQLRQYAIMFMSNNYILNYNRILIGTVQTGSYELTHISNNYFTYTKPISNNIYVQPNTGTIFELGNCVKGTLNNAVGSATLIKENNSIVA